MSAWTSTHESAIWRAYCRGVRGCQILPVNGDTEGAEVAMAIGSLDRESRDEPRERPEVLREVARLCGEEPAEPHDCTEAHMEAHGQGQEEGLRRGKLDLLGDLIDWMPTASEATTDGYVIRMTDLADWIAGHRKAVSK